MNILISNADTSANLLPLRHLFSEFGTVSSAMVLQPYRVGTGFCWLVMREPSDGNNAISQLDHTRFMHHIIGVRAGILTLFKK
jgi:hypothetical protein